ncbi:Gfo/Idh/MocA family oxidoreductase [Paenibacillus filicis]|uniref:Gfo/Idh/MocA family oxidoreductase n=1 Tax=Paenibacillus gyeongsangnamensis TaxID=3388067 RepID=A0ABT4Q4W5_9BACL|nr:Gfo/Idh/MocA family oxidoreductase [Paenibacillus filicis]MCZ8511893.1 Gfo/Idh/MocA family oxidoreductase [Paenibacillus filicis]
MNPNSGKIKIGLVGLGNIGKTHVRYLSQMEQVELVGVCDVVKEKADKFAEENHTQAYYRHQDLLEQSGLDAVIIAVPHYDHPTVAIDAFARGIHVMCEKPIAVHLNDAQRMLDAYEEAKVRFPKLEFGLMFQERTYPFYRKIKEMLNEGVLGKLTRATWIHTEWFRSQAYYDSGDWRATWAGEGGGILTNQCPHTLDMYQWLFGIPSEITGHAHIGKYHNIEVEDEVTAYFEHENGMIGHLIVTTAELPGTNRLEIIGENGKLVLENGQLVLYKNPVSMLKYSFETTEGFRKMDSERIEIDIDKDVPTGHKVVTEKFVRRLLSGEGELIAEGPEGVGALTLANGIMLSSFRKSSVSVPVDADAFEAKLKELIQTSKYVKKAVSAPAADEDMSQSFSSSK